MQIVFIHWKKCLCSLYFNISLSKNNLFSWSKTDHFECFILFLKKCVDLDEFIFFKRRFHYKGWQPLIPFLLYNTSIFITFFVEEFPHFKELPFLDVAFFHCSILRAGLIKCKITRICLWVLLLNFCCRIILSLSWIQFFLFYSLFPQN